MEPGPSTERTRLSSRSEEPTASDSPRLCANNTNNNVLRRNSSNTMSHRFRVTPSSNDIANLAAPSAAPPVTAAPYPAQIRKASAPAFSNETHSFVDLESPPAKEQSEPVHHRGVQFDVGVETCAEEEEKTIGSANNDTIGANVKSWRYLKTLDHPPLLDFYRNSTDEGGPSAHRPSMLQLLHGDQANEVQDFQKQNEDLMDQQLQSEGQLIADTAKATITEAGGVAEEKKKRAKRRDERRERDLAAPLIHSSPAKCAVKPSTPRKKFGWIEGVFFRCVLNIFGVILYLRVSWVSGQAGVALGQLVVLLASLVTTITALSTCAICTNGEIKGGGAYFLISRSLGPEFGGSIGLIFSVANAVGAAMYVVGFAETVRDLMKEYNMVIVDGELNDVRLIGLVTCCVLMGIVFIGTGFESKMQMGLLVVLLVSIANYFLGTFLPPTHQQRLRGITGYSWHTLKENLLPEFRDGHNFFSVFSIYFPAATGIMAGANISGDLSDPQHAIPLGTLIAIFFTTVVYLLLILATGSTCVRDADGLHPPALLPAFSNASQLNPRPLASYVLPECAANGTCPYGLSNYFQVIEVGSFWGPLITSGIFAAALSSALASLVSAPKIFQAVCKDRLFPYITCFGQGSGKDDEPRRAYLLGFVLAMLIVLVGDLNAIAPIISNFFLCSYALINYACFDNSFADSPGFRPAFKYYNMWVSLLGAIMCVTVMFIVSWFTALLTFFFFALLFLYISHRKPDVNWGSSAQAHSYRNALHGVTKLEHTDEHVKNYRPQVLVLTGNPAARPSLVDFVANITKDTSLMICGYVVPYNPSDQVYSMLRKLNDQLRVWLKKRHVKAFYISVANSSIRAGAQSLIQTTGLGKLRPNVLAMGFKQDWQSKGAAGLAALEEYFGIIQDAFDAQLGVMILRSNAGGLDFSEMMRTHNVGDAGRLKLPDIGQALRPNNSENSLANALSAAASSPQLNGQAELLLANNALRADSSQAVNLTKGLSSTNSSLRESQTQPDEDYVSCSEEYDEDECEDEDEFSDDVSQQQKSDPDVARVEEGALKKATVTFDEEAQITPDERKKLMARRRNSRRLTTAQRDLLSSINRFQRRLKKSVIDVWWLYDDGGLSLLVPYLLSQPKSYLEGATLRLFSLSTTPTGLEQEHRAMVALLSKFRMQFSDIHLLPDVGKKPKKETLEEFNKRIEPFRGDSPGMISDQELANQRDRTMRQLRVAELLRENSVEADLIILSMPIPRKGITSGALYLSWLDTMTRELPPTLMVRGNQQSVLTFYS